MTPSGQLQVAVICTRLRYGTGAPLAERSRMKRWIGLLAACAAVSGCGSGSPATTSHRRQAIRSRPQPVRHQRPAYWAATRRRLLAWSTFTGRGANQLTPGTPSTGKWEVTLSRAGATLTHPQDSSHVTSKVAYADGRITFAGQQRLRRQPFATDQGRLRLSRGRRPAQLPGDSRQLRRSSRNADRGTVA